MILSHPPGYPIVIATIYKISGNSDRALRLFQIASEAVTAVLVFLIAAHLVPHGAAVIAALLVAVAPQLAYRSLVFLPDTLSTLPLVAAIFLITKAVEDRGLGKLFLAGALIGVSAAWFRPDSVLLPIFLCAVLLLLLPRSQMRRAALVLLGGSASYLWTRYPRKLVKSIQKLFVTRYFLPLTIFGVILLAAHRRKVALALLLTLPLYYLASHAPIHFEYRYILPVYFFWFIFAGVAIYWLGLTFARVVLRMRVCHLLRGMSSASN